MDDYVSTPDNTITYLNFVDYSGVTTLFTGYATPLTGSTAL
jgi:hypothetical protein